MLTSVRLFMFAGSALGAAMVLPSAAAAANCVRHIDILNSDRDENFTFLVESRTRANRAWRTERINYPPRNRTLRRAKRNLQRRLPRRQNNDGVSKLRSRPASACVTRSPTGW